MTSKKKSNALAPYQPLEWQKEPLNDKSLILLMTGSAGGGKSRTAAEKIHAYCQTYPNTAALMMRKAREWNSRSILPFYSSTVTGSDPNVTFNKSEGTFYYKNGSVVYSGGMLDDKQREAVRSIGGSGGLDIAWMEEANAFTRQDFEEVLGRIRHTAANWQQVILTTNPGGSLHWIKKDLIDGKQASVYYSRAQDNPNNSSAYIDTLGKLTGVMRERLVLGKWVQAEGAIYDMFDHRVHVKERPDSEMKSWYLAMDEGYTNPAVILLVGEDSDGRIHIAKQYYERGKLQEAVVKQASEWSKAYGVRLAAVDEAAAGLIADLLNNGVPAIASKGRVLDGIQSVQNRLKIQGDELPRLTVDPSCVDVINEFESYVWKKATGTGIVKDEPNKENDHAMDAVRYLDNAIGKNLWFMS